MRRHQDVPSDAALTVLWHRISRLIPIVILAPLRANNFVNGQAVRIGVNARLPQAMTIYCPRVGKGAAEASRCFTLAVHVGGSPYLRLPDPVCLFVQHK